VSQQAHQKKHSKISRKLVNDVLEELRDGATVATLSGHHGVPRETIERWQSERIRELEAENRELKATTAKLAAEPLSFDTAESDIFGMPKPSQFI
jgi:transposase-like protein